MDKKKDVTIKSSAAEYLTYVSAVGDSVNSIEIRYENENIWLTQKMMAALYDVSVAAINQHIKKIFEDNELDENSVIKNYLITANDGKNYDTKHYSLQMIIAVGFKVNSQRAIDFRLWAINILKQYSVKGYVLDKERLKNGAFLDENYFDELLQEIREIRISERNFYQKITDIYSTSLDYNSQSPITQEFLRLFKIKCIMQLMEILLQKLL